MSSSYPRKYWWIVLIILPIILAVIAVIPRLHAGSEGGGNRISIEGSTVGGDVQIVGKQTIFNQLQTRVGEKELAALKASVDRAVNLAFGGFKKDAIAEFEKLSKQTKAPAIYSNLGALYLAENRPEEARRAFKEGIAADPSYEPLRLNLARLYEQEGKIPEAIEQLEGTTDVAHAEALRTKLQGQAAGGKAEREPNNTILQANPFVVGQTVISEVSGATDNDYFKFRHASKLRDKVKVVLENQSPTLRPWLKVYDANKSEIVSRANDTYGANLEVSLTMEPESDYYVQVLPYNTRGKYRLSVIAQHAFDKYEANDDPFSATRIEAGRALGANIMDSNDTDWYQLGAAPAEEVKVKLENQSRTLRPWVKVYDANKSEIVSRANDTHGADLEFAFKAARGSSYYISVLPYNTAGDYRLSVR